MLKFLLFSALLLSSCSRTIVLSHRNGYSDKRFNGNKKVDRPQRMPDAKIERSESSFLSGEDKLVKLDSEFAENICRDKSTSLEHLIIYSSAGEETKKGFTFFKVAPRTLEIWCNNERSYNTED